MSDYKELRRLAEAATPGPWEQQKDGWTVRVEQSDTEKERGWRICYTMSSGPHRAEQEVNDAAYIASANPAAIIELLDRLAEAEKRANESDNQLVWLAGWCERTTGVRNNLVIGRDGWPNVLVEVVAQAVETERDALRADNARLWECVKEYDRLMLIVESSVRNMEGAGTPIHGRIVALNKSVRASISARSRDGGEDSK